MATFNVERRAFDRLRSDCSDEARSQFETALRVLLERYDTTIHENRFVTGGALEVFTCAILRSVGIGCTLHASRTPGSDLLLSGGQQLSVKGSFTGKNSSIALMNKMGKGLRDWETATLFVVSGVGIVFGTPKTVSPEHVKDTGDQVILTFRGLRSLLEDPDNVFQVEIARKPPTEVTGFSRKASYAVAKEVLRETGATALLGVLPSPEEGYGLP